MERPFQFNGVPVKTPDEFYPTGATTSTEDSGRTQDFEMHNTVIGPAESYHFAWENIEVEEAKKILNQIKGRSRYNLRYMSPSEGTFVSNQFYTANYSFGTLKKSNGKYVWESLSFNAVSVYSI